MLTSLTYNIIILLTPHIRNNLCTQGRLSNLSCVITHLAGHNGGPGLILRKTQLSEAAAGARAKEADVIGNLHDGAGHHITGTAHLHHGVMGGESLELVGSSDEGEPGQLRHLGGDLEAEIRVTN